MFYWIYDIATPRLAMFISVVFLGIFWVGCFLIRPLLRTFVRSRSGFRANEIVGNVLSCFGVFYGLLLGLIAVAVYQNLEESEDHVSREAVALTALYQDLEPYPDPIRQSLQGQLRDYCQYVIQKAWPLQRQGIVPAEGRRMMQQFRRDLARFEPQTMRELSFHSDTLRQFDTFYEARRQRLYDVSSGIPAVMWYVVLVGAVLNLAIIWMFDMRLITQLVLGGILAFFMGTMIFLIAALDNPFRGEVSVGPDAFIESLEVMGSAGQPEGASHLSPEGQGG